MWYLLVQEMRVMRVWRQFRNYSPQLDCLAQAISQLHLAKPKLQHARSHYPAHLRYEHRMCENNLQIIKNKYI